MSHFAAIIPAAKAPIVVQKVETPTVGPHELLIKNELVGLLPIDAKLAKAAILPLQYPAILDTSFGGTVVAVGDKVTGFNVGDKVAAAKTAGAVGNKFSAFQQYVVTRDITTSNIPKRIDLNIPVSLIGNLSTVVGLFTLSAGLGRPDLEGQGSAKDYKVLVYGGTSSVGSLSVQYVTHAGYKVVTTTSPKHESFVSKLGALRVIDHTQNQEALVNQLVEEGPYDLVVDAISIPSTLRIAGAVLSAQGGGDVYALLPPFGPDTLPQDVRHKFGS
ncbi:chaperonin 10-like protein [Aspergillus ambiguus]|uniref:chaperonin 10-like protein n=1 Tax=Aspergillus ambiguus TaxID=176160 RepID=UPI003CCC93E7